MALTDNLVSYWELEEASGTRVDSHGSNDLNDNNTVTSATGIQGTGADFEATNSESLDIADASQTGLEPTTAYSGSIWINPESIGTYWIWGKQGNGDADITYALFMTSTYVQFRNRNGTGTLQTCQYNVSLSTATWYHLVFTFSTTNGMRLYFNGSIGTTESAKTTAPSTNSNEMTIGVRDRGTSGSDLYFDGVIDEVGFWDRELSSTEVTELYNSGSGLSYSDITGGGGGPTFTPQVMWFS